MSQPEHSKDQALFDILPHGLLVVDQSGLLLQHNQRAREYLNLHGILSESTNIMDILPDSGSKALFISHKPGTIELSVAHGEQQRQLRMVLTAYADDQWIWVIEDITYVHRLEAMRHDFIANVSHELRTPLTVFRGYLEILQSQPAKIDSAKLQNILQQMSGQCQTMERLVEDLLLLSRLEHDMAGAPASFEIVNVSAILEDICADANTLSGEQAHLIELEVDHRLQMKGNIEELWSAFSNIIYNAIHYTPAKGQIKVRWFQDAAGKQMVVSDTGIGIAEKYIPRLTQRFYRVDQSRSFKGQGESNNSGLGLAIVKHVLLRHNGELSIESQPGEGSVFRCTFPLEEASDIGTLKH